jgi:hypothetical protein
VDPQEPPPTRSPAPSAFGVRRTRRRGAAWSAFYRPRRRGRIEAAATTWHTCQRPSSRYVTTFLLDLRTVKIRPKLRRKCAYARNPTTKARRPGPLGSSGGAIRHPPQDRSPPADDPAGAATGEAAAHPRLGPAMRSYQRDPVALPRPSTTVEELAASSVSLGPPAAVKSTGEVKARLQLPLRREDAARSDRVQMSSITSRRSGCPLSCSEVKPPPLLPHAAPAPLHTCYTGPFGWQPVVAGHSRFARRGNACCSPVIPGCSRL